MFGVYNELVRTMEGLAKRNEAIRLLAESTILLPLSPGLQDVADVVNSVQRLPYTYTILTEDHKWYEATNKVQTFQLLNKLLGK